MSSLIKRFTGSKQDRLDDLSTVSCPICLEIYDDPRQIACGHIFCAQCLQNVSSVPQPHCPVCRQNFKPEWTTQAAEIIKIIESAKAVCSGCVKEFAVSQLRAHNLVCPVLSKQEEASGLSTQQMLSNAPVVKNRFTFTCPICNLRNLDTNGLRTHCLSEHSQDRSSVVCPICASMPWGDATYKSRDFVAHMNLRHKIEYETLVDFTDDEESVLERVLRASLEEQ